MIDWIRNNVELEYEFSIGQWIDMPALAESNICALRHAGGTPTVADDRRQRFQIILLGPKNKRESALPLLGDANRLVERAITGSRPLSAANLRAIGETIGPAYTAENRPWVQVDFEVVT